MIVVRYADGSVVRLEQRRDVLTFLANPRKRMAKFGLQLNEESTWVLEFGRYAVERRAHREQRRSETLDFLGFTHICATIQVTRHFTVRRLTSAKRMRSTLQTLRRSLM